jgi:hypothetical protein
MNKLLKDDGYVFFTLPDKKYSFDLFRNNTEISHLINDYYNNNSDQLHYVECKIYYNYIHGKAENDLAKNRF